MEEIENLRKRIDKIEYSDIKDINSTLSEIKITLAEKNLLIEQSIKSNEKLSDTLDSVTKTMHEMATSIVENTKRMSSFEEKLVKTNEKMDSKFSELTKNVESVDNKSKVDILDWLNKNWIKVIVLVELGWLLVSKYF